MRKLSALVLFTVLAAAGCQRNVITNAPPATFNQGARDAVATAYGVIGDLQTRHQAQCVSSPTTQPCVLINKGVAVQRLAAQALNAYCSGPAATGDLPYLQGGPCSVVAGYDDRLQSALSDLSSLMIDIRQLN